ncbi:MAG: maleylpyruvate isomerase N-terminal domain-containing protein [Chitinophagales bacterium]|nr:maleylpyruvate isomerase N-terminal domain-containing protein [Chitinophagales bacterium]
MLQPVGTALLIREMDKLLINYLSGLKAAEWESQTIAKKWKVKDVVAHLLDGNIRSVSMLGDGYWGEQPSKTEPLVDFLNRLNADWVKAMKRVSPSMLIALHRMTGPLYCDLIDNLDPNAQALFAVDWAGEKESKNWMHIAREYTEKWLHQQQIRAANDNNDLLSPVYYLPFMNTFMLAMPYTLDSAGLLGDYRLKVEVSGDSPMIWYLVCENRQWKFAEQADDCTTSLSIPASIAWKLFSKSIRPEEVEDLVIIEGDERLARGALEMVSVMA